MKKKQILKALSLLTAVCIAAGCNASTAVETTTTTAEITTTTAKETGQTDGNSDLPELEIDYVDEYGYTYYKNPTVWTIEEVFDELTINGQKFSAPLTFEKLGDGYSYSLDGAFYDEETRTACLRLMYNDKSLAWVYLDDCDSIEDISGKIYNKIQFDVNVTDEEFIGQFKICDLSFKSSKEDLFNKMGIPAVCNGKYAHYINTDEKPGSYDDIKNRILKFYISQDTGNIAIISVWL